MGVNECHRDVPARVRDPQHPHPAVVSLHVLDEPIDGVVRVGRRVDRIAVRSMAERAIPFEFPFRTMPATRILHRDNILLLGELAKSGIEVPCEFAVRLCDAVGSPHEYDWQRFSLISRRIDFRVKPDAVTCGNHDLGLGVLTGSVSRLCPKRWPNQNEHGQNKRGQARRRLGSFSLVRHLVDSSGQRVLWMGDADLKLGCRQVPITSIRQIGPPNDSACASSLDGPLTKHEHRNTGVLRCDEEIRPGAVRHLQDAGTRRLACTASGPCRRRFVTPLDYFLPNGGGNFCGAGLGAGRFCFC